MSAFTVFITIHIISGTVCLITGAIAASAMKKKGKHTYFGEIYYWTYVLLFLSAVATAVIHWSRSSYLFYIAIFSYALALIGYLARKRRWKNWLATHIGCMLGSYIGIITAALVVNSSNIPYLNREPVLIFWFLPTIIGTPLILRVGKKYRKPKKAIQA